MAFLVPLLFLIFTIALGCWAAWFVITNYDKPCPHGIAQCIKRWFGR